MWNRHIIVLDTHSLISDSNESALSIIRTSHRNPPIASSETFRFEGYDGYTLSLAGLNVNRIYNFVDDNVNSVGVGGADIVTKLIMKVRYFKREESPLGRKDQRLGRAF
jgi:hypothetical protein